MEIIFSEVSIEYLDNANTDLLIFAMNNFNELFLKQSLRNSIFGSHIMIEKEIIDEIFSLFKKRCRSELILNVLLFSDLSRWQQTNLRSLLSMIAEIVTEEIEQNRILLAYNPILTIALCAEFLGKISFSKNIFRHQCNIVKN